MRHLTRDLRYAFRGLARSPLFTGVALLSIALGIGANTAIFTLVDEVLLRRLPVTSPDQLVLFSGPRNHYGSNSGGNMLSFPMYEDFRERGGGRVAVLSYDYWRNRFGADRAIVGKPITINNYTFTIVGVSQAGFDGVDIGYVPSVRVPVLMKAQMTPNWDDVDNRRSRWVNVFGRLKPGTTLEQAKAVLQPYFHAVLEEEVLDAAFSGTT